MPLAAVPDESGRPLLMDHFIHALATGRDLVSRGTAATTGRSIVAGVADFGPARPGRMYFAPLWHSRAEAKAVAELVPGAHLVETWQLTRELLLGEVNAPPVLHLATHGFYRRGAPDVDPLLRAWLALDDANAKDAGVLTAKEVAKLRLDGTQLVVLSACETAVGPGSYSDGIVGLLRSLTLAGSRSQLLSLWPVEDSATKELMTRFYVNAVDGTLTKAEALRRAQLALAEQGFGLAQWAPFVLDGDAGPFQIAG